MRFNFVLLNWTNLTELIRKTVWRCHIEKLKRFGKRKFRLKFVGGNDPNNKF